MVVIATIDDRAFRNKCMMCEPARLDGDSRDVSAAAIAGDFEKPISGVLGPKQPAFAEAASRLPHLPIGPRCAHPQQLVFTFRDLGGISALRGNPFCSP
mmetsp:Transcript_1595/g.3038  ORF Transcript_1595/g.3038 Transcript_1595/m.3038 type:complete len:99 (-) Transcript_1595:519-815(-)